jgi:hypothetical protein
VCAAANFVQELAVAGGLDAGAVEAGAVVSVVAVATGLALTGVLLVLELEAGATPGAWAAVDALLAVPAPAVQAVTDKPSAATAHAETTFDFNRQLPQVVSTRHRFRRAGGH